jgi:alditol oxidase
MTSTNWAGNVRFSGRIHRPDSVDSVRRLVAAADKVRPLGTAHSFSTIADTDGDLISVAEVETEPVLDGDTVTVGGGIRYGELARWLTARGYALHNLGSLPHISVAGACATGTHGSGAGNGCLTTAVRRVELVTAGGDLTSLDGGALVHLGALGVVTRVSLAVEPVYPVRQYVYDDLPWHALTAELDRIMAAGYSVSVFTDWERSQVWAKLRDPDPAPDWLGELGARPADGPRHPIVGHPADYCTAQLGEPGPWHERLPHFRLEFTPSSGEELQSEFLIAREDAAAALAALHEIADIIQPALQVSEIRAVAADDLWLSMAFGRDSTALHFTWVADWSTVEPALHAVEAALQPYDPRPHWGKISTLKAAYPKVADFLGLRDTLDPDRKFTNPYLDRFLD